jgi:peptide/nickel transport system permease protein
MINSSVSTPAVESPVGRSLLGEPAGMASRPRLLRRGNLLIGSAILLVLILSSVFASWISPHDPIQQNLTNTLRPPSALHPFGTDNFGRDIFSRVLHATKLDLQIGVLCVLFPWIIGVALGCVAGYFGGWADTIIMRVVDTFSAFPFLIMVIGIIAIIGPGLTGMYIALTLAGWSAYARIIRGEILVVKKSEYAQAARALGYSNARIMFRHILPNVIAPAIVFSMSDIVLVILSTTSLSFLGLGVQPPTPEWGSMIAEGKGFILTAWWMVTLPGLAIVLVGLALSMFGDGITDLMRTED